MIPVILEQGTTLEWDGQHYGPGDEVSLPDDLAASLIRTGSAKPKPEIRKGKR